MSSYVEFYAVNPEKKVPIPIASFGRSNYIYRAVEDMVPYGKAVKMTAENVKELRAWYENEADGYKSMIEDRNQEIELISKMDAPIKEKMEEISERRSSIDEIKCELNMLEQIDYTCWMIDNILTESRENEVWFGIDCGSPFSDEQSTD